MRASFHSLLIQILALWKGLLKKQVASKAGFTPQDISDLLKQEEMDQEDYGRLLGAVRGTPVEVTLVTGCLEALDALERDVLREAERERIELAVLEAQRILRNDLTEAALRSRKAPSFDGYPKPDEVEPTRWQAREVWPLLRDHPEPLQQVLVRHCRQFQTWAFMELVCHKSVEEASRDPLRAASLARLAAVVAETVRGPEGWLNRVKGYAAAHGLDTAEANRLWLAGSDPDNILNYQIMSLAGIGRRGP